MQPLEGVRVLGVTTFLAGPFGLMTLATLGAEAIRVELPGKGDAVRGNGPYIGPKGINPKPVTDLDISNRFLKRSRGTKSITLDLKNPEGRQLFLDLAKKCDVVLENLSPGSMKRLGLGYEEVSAVNPGIVYCSISGYGQSGPYASKPAHDPQIQAMAGLMDINGEPDGPPTRVGFYIGDLVTPLFACYSIVSCLREKERTGQGRYLDVSMMDALISIMFMENLEEAVWAGAPVRNGSMSRTGPTGLYRAQDGDLTLTATSDAQWRRLCEALDAPELLTDPRFATYGLRGTTYLKECQDEVQKRIAPLTRDAAIARLETHDVPCSPVRAITEIIADQHIWQRGTLQPMRHGGLEGTVEGAIATGFPVLFSGEPLRTLSGAPLLGQHNKDVYGGILGLSDAEVTRLAQAGVI